MAHLSRVILSAALALAFWPSSIGREPRARNDIQFQVARVQFCYAYLRWVDEFAKPGEADGLVTLNRLCEGRPRKV